MTTSNHGPARRPQMSDGGLCNDPTIQWSNHLKTPVRDKYFDGFLVPTGQDKRDNGLELDKFLTELNWEQVQIKHIDGKVKTYWALPVLDAFVIATGVQSWSEIKLDTDPATSPFVRYGIAAAWNDSFRSSMLRLRCLPTAWLAAGWEHPLTLSVKSYFALDVIKVLTRHFDCLDAIDNARKAQGKEPLNPPFYEVSVEFKPGEALARKVGTPEVTPIVTGVPDNITLEYLRAHYVKPEWKETIGALVDQTVLWSQHESKRLASMKDDSQQPAQPAAADAPTAPQPRQNGARNAPVPVAAGDFQGDEDLPF